MPYGRNVSTVNSPFPTRVSADGAPFYKTGGITLDMTTLPAAAGTDTTLPDGSIIKAGFQFLRYGQVVTKITASGKFGPYDPAAGDGRQLLARGNAFILDETLVFNNPIGGFGDIDITGRVIEGGLVFIDRVLNSGVGAASLAAGPTLANVETTFPTLREARN